MPKKKIKSSCCLVMAGVFSLSSGCATVEDTWRNHKGKIVGTVAGAAAGALAGDGDVKFIAGGAVAGFALGYLWDKRQQQLEELSREEGIDLEINRVSTFNNKSAVDNGLEVTVKSENMFNPGSSHPTGDAEIKFRKIAQKYVSESQQIMIIGHTDAMGEDRSNQKLSEDRAKNVAALFSKEGVPLKNIYYQGAGEAQPIASNQTSEGRSLNRRVEIIEIDSEQSLAAYALARSTDRKYVVHTSMTEGETAHAGSLAPKPDNIIAKPKTEKGKKSARKSNINIVQGHFVDFGGKSAASVDQNEFTKLWREAHSDKNPFSLIATAHADTSQNWIPCYLDRPRRAGEVKRLSNGQPLDISRYTPREYIPGMAGTAWVDTVNGHLVALSGVRVLRDSATPVGATEVLVYKEYDTKPKEKADYRASSVINTYRGDSGLIYRVFGESSNSPIQCIDLILPEQKPFEARTGSIYYQTPQGIYSKVFKPRMILKGQ